MQFVYPLFLWALLSLAIPILIHLFNFRRVKKVYFSNVRLLKEVKTETNSFRRLKHLLILLARLGFITFLVLAFAQPYFPSENQKNIENLSGLVSIYLDNSYSMQSKIGNEKYLDLASVYISQLVKVFPEAAKFQLITNNFENQEQYPISAREIEDRLTETSYSSSYRTLENIFKRQSNLLNRYSEGGKNQVFWFTDFQKSTLGKLDEIKLDTANQYYIIPMKSEKTPNLMVDSVWLSNPFVKALESNKISVRIQNFSEEKYDDLVLKLFIDNRQVSTANLDIPPNGTATGTFNFTVDGRGKKACKITFEDFPIIFDNEYFFVINAAPKIDILNLYDRQNSRYVQSVYSNESVFALNSYDVNNLDYKRIESASVVVLNELQDIEGELKQTLQKFTQSGGSLVVFPAANPSNSLTQFLSELGVGGVRTVRSDSTGTSTKFKINPPNGQNPFFKGMFVAIPPNMDMPAAIPTLQWINAGNNLLSFKNNRAFFSQFSTQGGKLYLFASPLSSENNNLAKHAIFVPIMYKIASSSQTIGDRLAYNFQEKTIRLRLDKPSSEQVYKLVNEDLELIPAQNLVDDQLLIEMPEEALPAGFYKLMLDNKQEGLLAFNYGKAESEMSFYSLDEIKSRFAQQENVQVFDFNDNSQQFISDFKAQNIRYDLWKYMLVFALGFLLVEILLIRFL